MSSKMTDEQKVLLCQLIYLLIDLGICEEAQPEDIVMSLYNMETYVS